MHTELTTPSRGSKKRAFVPSRWCGEYRMPPSILTILENRLREFRNREAAFRLAVFLARMNAAPKRMGRVFPIDRRVLASHPDLGLSEDRIRGAILTLEKVGYLERQVPAGSSYRRADDGVKRKAIQFLFGFEFAARFRFFIEKPLTRVKKVSPIGMVDSKLNSGFKRALAIPLGEKREKKVLKSLPPRDFGYGRVMAEPSDDLRASLDRFRAMMLAKSAGSA